MPTAYDLFPSPGRIVHHEDAPRLRRLLEEVAGARAAIEAGCTDPAAANFNPAAGRDDGSCLFTAL